MGMSAHRTVGIVGAGPVGGTLAILLARAGWQVDLYERRVAGGVARSATVNLSLSPHGMAVLDQAGVGDAVRAESVEMDGRVRYGVGTPPDTWDYPTGWRNHAADREALTQVVQEAARRSGASVHEGAACRAVDPRRGRLDFDGHTKTHDLIVGADGAYSLVRSAMARCAGFDVFQRHYRAAYGELSLQAGGLRPRAIHIWPRGRCFMVALPHHDGDLKAALIVPAEAAERLADTEAYARALFPEHADRIRRAPSVRPPTRDFVTVRCGAYHLGDRCALVGDAAHAMVPFMGQGVNAGLQDAASLARHLIAGRGLQAYSAERQPEGVAAAELSLWNHGELCGERRFGPPAPAGLPPVLRVNFTGESYCDVHKAVGLRRELPRYQETA